MDQLVESSRSDIEFVIRVLRRRRGLIILAAVVTTAAALGFSLLATKKYTSTAVLLFRPPQPANTTLNSNSAQTPTPISDRDAATNVGLVGLYETARATTKALRPPYRESAQFVKNSVTVSGVGTANLVNVSATTSKPALSAAIANTYAQQFIAGQMQQDRAAYQQALAEVNAQLAHPARLSALEQQTLQTQAQQLRLLSVLQTGDAHVAQPALVSSSPSSPDLKKNALVGLLVGLVLGLALALLLERLDRRLKDVDELETAVRIPVLGAVPESTVFNTSHTTVLPEPEAEAFRMLRARLRYFNVDRDISSLMIVSGEPSDGKSTVAYYLALAAANTTGTRVLLVEADLRRPQLAERIGLRTAPGLAEVLSQPVDLDDALQSLSCSPDTIADDDHVLDVLVAGALPPNPAELLESQKMRTALDELTSRYDLVVVDTAPTGVVSDALPLLHQVDGVLLVARMNHSTRAGLSRLFDQLESLRAPLLGVVANHFIPGDNGYGYGYGYGYGGRNGHEKVVSSNGRPVAIDDEDPTEAPDHGDPRPPSGSREDATLRSD